jgi:hypothetical protein
LDAGLVPDPVPVERFREVWERNPFSVATVVDEANAGATFALMGMVQTGDKMLVTLFNKKSQERFVLAQGETRNGLRIVSIKPHAELRKVTLMVQSGSETLQVAFDPSLNAPAGQGQPATPPGQRPGVPNAPNQSNLVPPNPAQGGKSPPERVVRRRIVVPSQPPKTP